MTKRGNGEGSIRKRPDGSWEGRYCIGRDPATGRVARRSVYAKTRGECAEKLREMMNKAAQAGSLYIASEKITVSEWLGTYLWDIKRPKLKPDTFQQYVYSVQSRIMPAPIAQMKMHDVRRYHAQAFVDALTEEGATPFTVRNVFGVLRNAFSEAERRSVVSISYLTNVALPVRHPKPMRILTRAEQARFTKGIKGHRLEAAFVLALTTGLREGEIAALTWGDLKDGKLHVVKNAIRAAVFDPVARKKTGSRVIIQETPKTAAGVRKIPLLPVTLRALDMHRMKQNDERVRGRLLYQDNGLIFCSELGTLYEPQYFREALHKALESAGLPKIKFHALRHTFATRGLEAEISVRSMQSLLGHETPEMVMHYQQLLDDQAEEEMAKLKNTFL
jgi:integrase